jgi:hypothetical protein
MVMWCKAQYHEAFERYKMDSRAFPKDGLTVSADITEVQVWEKMLYYLTQDEQWLE